MFNVANEARVKMQHSLPTEHRSGFYGYFSFFCDHKKRLHRRSDQNIDRYDYARGLTYVYVCCLTSTPLRDYMLRHQVTDHYIWTSSTGFLLAGRFHDGTATRLLIRACLALLPEPKGQRPGRHSRPPAVSLAPLGRRS